MAEVAALQLRPKSLDEMIGQAKLVNAIREQFASGRVPKAWMFVGETGSGKTTLARILALSLNCAHNTPDKGRFGTPCVECYRNRTDFQIFEINASEVSGVDDIAEVVKGSNYVPLPPSKYRVYLLDEAHQLSNHSQNLLLKYFEDSPTTTIWVILTTEPNKILKTLRGRCMVYPLSPLTSKGVEKLLEVSCQKLKVKEDTSDLLEELIRQKVTSPRHILNSLEKFLAGTSAEESVLGGEATVNTLRVCQAVVKGDFEGVKQEMSTADLNDSRVVRMALASYLKSIMLGTIGEKSRNACDGIEMLAQASRTEEGLQSAYTIAVLYRICRKFQGGTK